MSEFDLPLASHMVAPVHVLAPGERLARAAHKLAELGLSALPVTDSRRRLIGVLERTDLLRVGRLRPRPEPGEGRFWWPDLSVAECMQTTVPVAPPERTLQQCARRMLERGLHRVYVLSDAELIGVLSTRELMRAVQQAELATPLTALPARPAQLVAADEPLSAACARLAASPEQALVVLAEGAPAGIFGRAELRACLEVDPAQPVGPYADDSLLVLDAEESAARAAERALEARVRYLVTRDRAGHHRVLSGLSFASGICGGSLPPPPLAEGLPTVTVPPAPPHRPARESGEEHHVPPVTGQPSRPRAEAAAGVTLAGERHSSQSPAAPAAGPRARLPEGERR